MSLFLIQTTYQLLLPPGGLLILLLAINLYGYRQHWKKQQIFFAILCLFYLLTTSIGADLLLKPLEWRYRPPAHVEGDVLVMLGSGAKSQVPGVGGPGAPSSVMSRSMLVAGQLQHETGLPLLVSGGVTTGNTIPEADIALREFRNLGLPADKLYGENRSRNTAENARFSARILAEHGWKRPVLLAAALHAPRAALFFRREGMDVVVYPTYYRSSLTRTGPIITWFIPNAGNLDNAAAALKEYVGILAVQAGMQ